MAILTREAILAGVKLPSEIVDVPELGGAVIVRGMTGSERDAFENGCFQGKGKKRDFSAQDVRAKLVAYCCIDEAGQRVFSDNDVALIGQVRADVVDRLFSVAARLSGMTPEDADELGRRSPTPPVSVTSSSPSLVTLG